MGIGDFILRRKALKMGRSPDAAAVGRKTAAEARYNANDFFSRAPDVEDRALGHEESFRERVSDNRFAR